MLSDVRYLKAIDLFNGEKFFECHEVLEEIWHEEQKKPESKVRDFIQGVIQVASALHQFKNANLRGAQLLYDSGLKLLAPYGDCFKGIDLKKLRSDMFLCFQDILKQPYDTLPGRGYPGQAHIPYPPPERIPKIIIQTGR